MKLYLKIDIFWPQFIETLYASTSSLISSLFILNGEKLSGTDK